MTEKEIKAVMKERQASSDIASITFIFKDKSGYVWAKPMEANIVINERYWALKNSNRRYSWDNVVEIHLIHSPALKAWLDNAVKNIKLVEVKF